MMLMWRREDQAQIKDDAQQWIAQALLRTPKTTRILHRPSDNLILLRKLYSFFYHLYHHLVTIFQKGSSVICTCCATTMLSFSLLR